MTDDILTLLVTPAPDLAPIPGGVTVYPADDGEGVVRLYAVLSDGAIHCLTPDAAGEVPPPIALTSPGSYGPTTPMALVTDAQVAGYLGVADRDLKPGDVIDCAWTQQIGASVGWGEVAILTGPATYGSPMLDVVAVGDAKSAMAGIGQCVALAAVTKPIAKGAAMWGVLAAWNPPGSQLPMPRVVSSLSTAGAALNTVPGWKPSGIGNPAMGWNAWAYAHPPVMTVILP